MQSESKKNFIDKYKSNGYREEQINFLWAIEKEDRPLYLFENKEYTMMQMRTLYWGLTRGVPANVLYNIAHPVYTRERMIEYIREWLRNNNYESKAKRRYPRLVSTKSKSIKLQILEENKSLISSQIRQGVPITKIASELGVYYTLLSEFITRNLREM